MTWTYAGTPGETTAATRRDMVRFLLGDVVNNTPTLSDEEIAAMLSAASDDTTNAAIAAGRALLMRFARYCDLTEGLTKVSASQRFTALKSQIAELETAGFTGANAAPYAGGTSKAGKQDQRDDTDWVAPLFARDDDSYPTLREPLRPSLVD